MTLDGDKLLGILTDIRESREVSTYYKRYLLREGWITRDKKPIEGRGRPGYYYSLSQKAEALLAVH